MKKMMLVLLVLMFVAPAMAVGPNDVNVYFSQVGDTNQVVLWYNAALADANRPRAWGLDITADNGATINNVTASKTGESTAASKGYGIFPGTIQINGSGTVTSWGSPAYSGEGTGTVTVELGSLYVGSPNAPATDANLLTFTVSGDCNLTATENAADGCVLDEKGKRKHPKMHGKKIIVAAGCGTCPLDIAGGYPEGGDGYVGPEDLFYLLTLINGCADQYCDVSGLSAEEQCLDVAGGYPEGGDGYVGPEDLFYVLTLINGCADQYCVCP